MSSPPASPATATPASPRDTAADELRQLNLVWLSLLAVAVGVVTGFGAIFLRWLMAVFHNLFFYGELSAVYDANIAGSPSPLGPLVILVPVIGGLVVVFLTTKFAPEARGHGVPEVMDAIYYKQGRIRPQVVIIKSLASALSIGSGASVGREGPIIQIGSGIGSVLGQVFHLRTWQVITLIAAGAGAGIAATFNTPLGGVMFAIELMLPELSSRTFLPVVLATGVATYVGRIAFGTGAAFLVPIQSSPELIEPISIGLLTTYAALGLLCGLAAMVFVRLLHWVEDRFDEMPYNPYVKNVIGMLGVGVLMYVLLLTTGAYHTEGVGYATIQSILDNQLTLFGLLLILFLAKLGATTVSLAAGASGGIFSPSLFLGATLGGAFGAGLDMMWPHLGLSPVPFAVIGMAAVVGGATGASMTAILMIFEMTGDYGITVGSIIAVACAVGIRRTLLLENIYTMKLARRGHRIPKERHMHMFLIRQAAEVMRPVVGWVQRDELIPTSPSPQRDATERPSYAVVVDGERIVGLVAVAGEDPRRAVSPVLAPVGIAREDTFLQSVMARMARRGHVATLVVKGTGVPRPENVVGVIARDSVADTIIADFAA